MKIKVLGPGCPRCQSLETNVRQAVEELGIDAEIEKITEMGRIMSYGVMSTPALVIDDKLIGAGKLFSVEEIKKIISCY